MEQPLHLELEKEFKLMEVTWEHLTLSLTQSYLRLIRFHHLFTPHPKGFCTGNAPPYH